LLFLSHLEVESNFYLSPCRSLHPYPVLQRKDNDMPENQARTLYLFPTNQSFSSEKLIFPTENKDLQPFIGRGKDKNLLL
jgi:hypothetical protein